MNKIVDLYVSRKDITTKMDVVQGATEPAITFVLKDYTPPLGADARIFIKKPLSEVYNACTLTGNEVTFNPVTQAFDQVGPCVAQLEIVDGTDILMSYRIYVMVEPSIIDNGAIEAENDFSALQQAILAVGDISVWKAKTDQNTDDIDAIEQKTDKLAIHNNVTRVVLGESTVTRIGIGGSSTNKVIVAVTNSTDNKQYNFLVKNEALTLYNATDGVEVFRINAPYRKGATITVKDCIGHGYATATEGEYYLYFDTPRELPEGATLTNVQVTNATLRGTGGKVCENIDITANVDSMIRSANFDPRCHITGMTTNFVANTPATIVCTLKFTIS